MVLRPGPLLLTFVCSFIYSPFHFNSPLLLGQCRSLDCAVTLSSGVCDTHPSSLTYITPHSIVCTYQGAGTCEQDKTNKDILHRHTNSHARCRQRTNGVTQQHCISHVFRGHKLREATEVRMGGSLGALTTVGAISQCSILCYRT
jgi:hypothetical protein